MTNVNCPDCNADQWDDLQQIKSTLVLTSNEKRPLTLCNPRLKACSCPLITWDFYCSTEHYTHLECCNIEGKSEIQNPNCISPTFTFSPIHLSAMHIPSLSLLAPTASLLWMIHIPRISFIPVAKSYSSSHQGSSLQPQSDYTVQTTNPHPRFFITHYHFAV